MNDLHDHGPRVRVALMSPSEDSRLQFPGLIDTGADMTAVDEALIKQLGYRPHGGVEVVTANGSQERSLYKVVLRFPREPGAKEEVTVDMVVAGLPKFGHDNIRALLGRDLLAMAQFNYHGPSGRFGLVFPQAAQVGVAGVVLGGSAPVRRGPVWIGRGL
ncbi:MAG: aspartyl protease family protein [Rhodanobacteraceae bacterium]|nr:aspartyl protease family protein [Rhodanobacteraceae bacterium]